MNNPLSTFFSFLKRQMPGAPAEHFQEAETALAEHVTAEVSSIENKVRDDLAAEFAAFKAEVLGEVDKVLAGAGLARAPSEAPAPAQIGTEAASSSQEQPAAREPASAA